MSDPRVEATDRAERVLVGALMLAPENLPLIAAILTSDDFRLELCREAYEAMAALDGQSQAIDPVTIWRQMAVKGSIFTRVQLSELMDGIPRATNVEAYASIVVEGSILRRIIVAAREVTDAAESGDTADDVITKAQAIMLAVGEGRQRARGLKPLPAALKEVTEQLQAATEGRQAGILSYGLPDLDMVLGGIHASELAIIGARPSIGKSALAFHIAREAAKAGSEPIAIFSIEMARRSVGTRLIGAEAMVDLACSRAGSLSEVEWAALLKAMTAAKEWPIWIDDAGTISVVEIAARSRRLKADKGLSLVIVDYLQLIRSPHAENRVQEIGAISRGLKALAKDLAVPVVALAQLNRSADGVRPMLSHLRESGDIEADADAVLLMWRPNEKDEDEVEIIVAKNRNGPTAPVNVRFRREYQRFESRARDDVYEPNQ